MNRNIIFKQLIKEVSKKKSNYTEEDLELFNEINDTIIEMEVARSMFDSVSEPHLIDLAIHTEDVAKIRFSHLISLAKKRELKNINII